MPRAPRNASIVPGALTHAISRLVDGRFLFDDDARAEYLNRLGNSLARSDWRLVSYALMSSHIHLGLIAGAEPMSGWVHRTHTAMAQWINRRARRNAPRTLGHVFATRPSTKHLDTSLAATLIAYHHNNPVRAGVVTDPADTLWTSHCAYLGLVSAPASLDVALGLRLCDTDASGAGRATFHRMVTDRAGDGGNDAHLLAGHEYAGSEPLADDRPAPTRAPVNAVEVLAGAAIAAGVRSEDVLSGLRTRPAVDVRRTALAAWRLLGGTDAEMAAQLRITRGAASKLLAKGASTRVQAAARDVVAALRK